MLGVAVTCGVKMMLLTLGSNVGVGVAASEKGNTSAGVSVVMRVMSGGGVASSGKYACHAKIPAISSSIKPARFKIRATKSFMVLVTSR
jgi:hypothetical protein